MCGGGRNTQDVDLLSLVFPFFFRWLVEFNGRTYLKWSSAYKQRLAI